MESFESEKEFLMRHVIAPIDKFVIGDLKVLDRVQPDETGLRGCAVPTAMLVLSAIEFLGFLLNKDGRLGESEKNMSVAFTYSDYFPKVYRTNLHLITIVYRHCMMHSAFPKHYFNDNYYAICKSEANELFITHSIGAYSINSLNVNTLSKDFQVFFSKLAQEIQTTGTKEFIETLSQKFRKAKKNTDEEYLNASIERTTTVPAPWPNN